MKINIEMDMTPAELRETLGLPDIKGVQDRWVAKLEDKLDEEIAKLSPEALAQNWTNALMPNSKILESFFRMAPGPESKD